MKALTVLQPWAQLLVLGEKRYETRSWSTGYRGPLLIHAGRRFIEHVRELCATEPFYSALQKHGVNINYMTKGAILGQAELVDCIPSDQLRFEGKDPEEAFGDFRVGRYAWRIENPQAFPEPIPYQGKLGLFDVKEELWKPSTTLNATPHYQI